METTETCTMCEKMVVLVESAKTVSSPLQLPNTFDSRSGNYGWRYHEIMAYALVPRTAKGTSGILDLYVCIEEDDLDDIDLRAYADRFLREEIFSKWGDFKSGRLLEPSLSRPDILECRKLRHFASGLNQ